jgi:exodeoxyribonuclease VII small subunit
MADKTKTETFEQMYSRLEESVSKLEQGGLSLEQAIALYEQGMALARQCQERLDEAELKITKLKETFAVLPERGNGALNDDPEEYEYVSDDDRSDEDREP